MLHEDYTCLGIDPSARAILLAQNRYKDIRFMVGTAPEAFGRLGVIPDAVLALDVLEHVLDDAALLSSFVQRAKPGSYIVLTVPADMSLWSQQDVTYGHYRRYDIATFRALWIDLPVREFLCSYFNARLYPFVRLARRFARLTGTAVGRAGTDLSLPPAPINAILEAIFYSELRTLRRLLHRQRQSGFASGVSLMAILQKQA